MDAVTIDRGDWRMTALSGYDFSGEKLSDVSFAESDLHGSRFDRCVFSRCDLTGADIHGASFRKADLRSCKLDQLHLDSADFKDAKIDLTQAVAFAETFGVKVIL